MGGGGLLLERARERENMSGSCQTLENVQWQRCARAAPCSPVSLLTHTGSIMSPPCLPPSSHSPLLPSAPLTHPPSVSLQLSLAPLPVAVPPHCVFGFASVSSLQAGLGTARSHCIPLYFTVFESLSVDQPVGVRGGMCFVFFFSCYWIQFGSVIFVSGNKRLHLDHTG